VVSVNMGKRIILGGQLIAVAGLMIAAACGGSSPAGPSGGAVTVISGSTGSTGTSGATITITAAGVSPSSVTVAVGQSVTFVNSSTQPHQPASNPHPQHGSCPSIESGLGTLAAGQTKLTQGFAGRGTCGFHDHLNDSSQSLQGTIVIQ
jgi:plastocyanin